MDASFEKDLGFSYPNKSSDIDSEIAVGEVVKTKPVYGIIKRVSDVFLSVVALVILSPVFIITAISIKKEDGGRIFFTQKRIGKDKKEFSMYKFRSMKKNADKFHEDLKEKYGETDISFKPIDDPRVTKIGKTIRRYNIDELPQLVNILKGEMSIVGPRPLPVYEFEDEQKEYGGKYDLRYSVPQGLTCLWQTSDRGEIDFETRMQMDVDYAKKCNLVMDAWLTVKTILNMLSGRTGF